MKQEAALKDKKIVKVSLINSQAMMDPGQTPADHLKVDFTEEALGNLEGSKNKKTLQKQLKKLWKKGVKVLFQYYMY